MLRIIILVLPGMLLALFCQAQKEDYNWVLGWIPKPDSSRASVVLNFNTTPVSIEYIDKRIGFDMTSSSLSDKAGNLRCISNGVNIYNSDFEIIQNGDNIQPSNKYKFGFWSTQGMIVLPLEKEDEKFILLTGRLDYFPSPIARLDPIIFSTFNDILVKTKNEILFRDSIANLGAFTAVRHANGRDWWILLLKNDSNKYFKILIRNGSPEVYGYQLIGEDIPNGWDHTVFSPDGNWYARYSWWGTTSSPHSSLYLYNFDRCSGQLSNFRKYDFKDDGPGGVAISANSKYLYASNWDTIFQYDLYAPDIFASQTVVAGYDGFRGEDGWPVRFFTPQLAPDNRIYLCVPNQPSRYLHYIEYPDSAGLACRVRQHAIKLPVYNSNTLPNLPYFRLFEDRSSGCDTIGQGNLPTYSTLQILPNPGTDALRILLPNGEKPHTWHLHFFTATGALAVDTAIPAGLEEFRLETAFLPAGIYFYELKGEGSIVYRGKWVKQ